MPRQSTVRRRSGRPLAVIQPEDDPEGLRGLGSHVLPAVRGAAVEVGAVARLQHVAIAVVLERHLALDDVEELHLPRLDDHLVGLTPRDRGPSVDITARILPWKSPAPNTCHFSDDAVEGDHRVVGLAASRAAARSGPARRASRSSTPRAPRQLAEGRQRRGEAPGLDLRQHARAEARLLGELALLQRPLGPEGLDPLAERGHASAHRRAGRPAAAARASRRRASSSCGTGGSGRCCRAASAGRYAASAARSISSGVRRSPDQQRARPRPPRAAARPPRRARCAPGGRSRRPCGARAATPSTGKSNEPRRRSLRYTERTPSAGGSTISVTISPGCLVRYWMPSSW